MIHSTADGFVDIQTVESLLASRPKFNESECDHTMLVAAAVAGVADSNEAAAAEMHLATCSECRAAVLLLLGIESQMKATSKAASFAPYQPRIRIALRPYFWIVAATAVLVLAVVVFRSASRQAAHPEAALSIKGTADLLDVAVKRGAAEFTARPLDRLAEGDKLGFFYSSTRDGFLAVFNIDNDNSVTRLYPALEAHSASIGQASHTPLPDGAFVRDGLGCEWIVAVFSDKALDLEKISELLRGADTTDSPATCPLTVHVPGARTVVVLPLRRK